MRNFPTAARNKAGIGAYERTGQSRSDVGLLFLFACHGECQTADKTNAIGLGYASDDLNVDSTSISRSSSHHKFTIEKN